MDLHAQLVILSAIAYFVGAIPFGLIAGKLKGVDIRQHGSRNIGATNAGRVLGKKYFWIVFFLDLLKSFVPTFIASSLVLAANDVDVTRLTYLLWILVGMVALVGHVFPIYLGFRGGKGVASSAGVVLGLYPYFTYAGVVAIAAFVVVVFIWRYISLASIVAVCLFPISYVLIGRQNGWDVFGRQLPLLVLSVALAVLVVWRHRENIARLRAGTENKVGARNAVTP
jgi:acyl phosphate:glycerol-3-phosphate acyltransferase